ncbi:MAG: hypothetical protein ACHQ16_05890 [Candidatus Lutacidiplasmatales archaeon]
MTVLEFAIVAVAGAVAGWTGHALYRWSERARPASPAVEPIGAEHEAGSLSVADAGPGPSRPRRVSEGASTAGRVILHLYAQGRLAPYEVAGPEFTQSGIGSTLELRQGTVTRVLTRLTAAGVLGSDRRHVAGRSRRLLVYTLTPLGESVARDLRRRVVGPSEPRPDGGLEEVQLPPTPRV